VSVPQHSCLRSTPLVTGRDWKDRAIGGAVIVLEVAKATAEAFGPLKAALEAASTIYNQYKVHSQPSTIRFSLFNQSPGNYRGQGKDRSSPFAHRLPGEDFRTTRRK